MAFRTRLLSYDVELDSTGEIQSVMVQDHQTQASFRRVELLSTVLIENGDESLLRPKFLGVVNKFLKVEDDLHAEIYWLYRTQDFIDAGHRHRIPKDLITCGCKIQDCEDDNGHYKEVFLSGHMQTVPCSAIIHPCQVFFLPGSDYSQLQLLPAMPMESGGVELVTADGSSAALPKVLLPGFVCRRFIDSTNFKVQLLTRRNNLEVHVAETIQHLLAKTKVQIPQCIAAFRAREESRLRRRQQMGSVLLKQCMRDSRRARAAAERLDEMQEEQGEG